MNEDREPLPTRVEGLPALPAEALGVLDAGLRELGLEDLTESVRSGLVDHVRLLIAWNQSINLTSIRAPKGIVREHVLDSLTAASVLSRRGIGALLDLGSGAGFPGLPLALALPAQHSLLVDSVGKKAAFLAAAVGVVQAGSTVDVFAGRAEALAGDPGHRERWPAVVARAIAPLAELAEIALPLVAQGGVLIAWKRRPFEAELTAAGPALARLGGRLATVRPVTIAGLDDHLLVVIDKVGPSPAGYPRDPARRRARPIAVDDPLPSA